MFKIGRLRRFLICPYHTRLGAISENIDCPVLFHKRCYSRIADTTRAGSGSLPASTGRGRTSRPKRNRYRKANRQDCGNSNERLGLTVRFPPDLFLLKLGRDSGLNGNRHRQTTINIRTRWLGGRMAARRAGATGRTHVAHRCARGHSCGRSAESGAHGRIPARPAAIGLDRRPQ
jgi:hypothetical protein